MLLSNRKINAFIFIFTLTFSANSFSNHFYVGADISLLSFEQVEFETVNVKSILAGYTFDRWSMEGSYNTSSTFNHFYGGEQSVDMFHLYGVYRSQGDLYYKVKLGVTNERYTFYGDDGQLKLDDVHTGVARGIGAGYQYGRFNIELEYSWLGLSLEMLGVGVRYRF